MGLRVNQNISALTALYDAKKADAACSGSAEGLSSSPVNSDKFRSQLRGLDQAATHAKEGGNPPSTAEGALPETHSILLNMRDLMLHAAL